MHARAAQVHVAEVQLDAPEAADAQAADAGVDAVLLHDAAARRAQLQAARVERRAARGSTGAGCGSARRARKRRSPRPAPGARGSAGSRRRSVPVIRAAAPRLLTFRTVDLHPHRRGAGAAAQARLEDTTCCEVELVDAPQVDLAQDAVVVPPAALERARCALRQRRDVELLAAAVDAHDEPVDAAASHALGAQLERQVGADVQSERLAVQPHPRAVVDRLEAQHPLGGRRRRAAGGSPCGTSARCPM